MIVERPVDAAAIEFMEVSCFVFLFSSTKASVIENIFAFSELLNPYSA